MKKWSMIFLSGALFSSVVNAGGGQALIPHYLISSASNCSLSISNISKNDVQVNIELIDHNGVNTPPNFLPYYAFAGKDPLTQSVSLAPQKTGAILFPKSSNTANGYGYISWTSDESIHNALVANMHCNNDPRGMQREITINGGMSF